MPLVTASVPHLEQIIDDTFPIWSEGLTRQAYSQWNAAQLQTAWGRRHLERVALVDEAGALQASAKVYRFDARLFDREGVVSGIGAVFTPPGGRGQGHASRLLDALIERERRAGSMLLLLFSEIGPEFYGRFGFVPVVLDEVTVTATVKGGSPAMLVRAGDERDLVAIAAMHDVRSQGAAFTLRRDRSLLQYAISKKRILAGLSPTGLRQVEFFVAEEGASAVAYVVLSENANGWTLEEAGDNDPAGARLGAMLQVLVAREPSHGHPLIRAWWPRGLATPPQLQLSMPEMPRDLMMVLPLRPLPAPLTADNVFYWHSDHF